MLHTSPHPEIHPSHPLIYWLTSTSCLYWFCIYWLERKYSKFLLGLPSSLIWIEGALAEIDLATTVQVSETQRILKILNLKHKCWNTLQVSEIQILKTLYRYLKHKEYWKYRIWNTNTETLYRYLKYKYLKHCTLYSVQVSETQRILKIPNLKHKYWKHCTGVRKNIENMCLWDHLLSNFLTCAFVDFVLFPAFVSSSFFSSSMGGGSGDMRRRYSCNIFISKNIDHLLVFVIKKTMRFIYLPFSDWLNKKDKKDKKRQRQKETQKRHKRQKRQQQKR